MKSPLPPPPFSDQRPTLPPLSFLQQSLLQGHLSDVLPGPSSLFSQANYNASPPMLQAPLKLREPAAFPPVTQIALPQQQLPLRSQNANSHVYHAPADLHLRGDSRPRLGLKRPYELAMHDSDRLFWPKTISQSITDRLVRDFSGPTSIPPPISPYGDIKPEGFPRPIGHARSTRSSLSESSTQSTNLQPFSTVGYVPQIPGPRSVRSSAPNSRFSLHIRQQPRAARAGPDGKDRRCVSFRTKEVCRNELTPTGPLIRHRSCS